jgi:arylsulfatase A-like enzyme
MHVLDYERALGELLELDDTIRGTIAHLKAIGQLNDTLIVVTADHGHGFDGIYISPLCLRRSSS